MRCGRIVGAGAALIAGLAGVGCSADAKPAPARNAEGRPPVAVTVASSVIAAPGAPIPMAFTCDGEGTSLPVSWEPASALTPDSWTLRVDDPDAPGGGFVHWVVEEIPPGIRSVASGTNPDGGAVRTAYRGPCPPKGSPPHHYVITVVGVRDGVTVGRGQLTGTYQRR